MAKLNIFYAQISFCRNKNYFYLILLYTNLCFVHKLIFCVHKLVFVGTHFNFVLTNYA